uniref:ShKT domain-containing protein n=1 Tax=Amphilophus citrinellus TaxID=61819 RepID=A0A3Q0QT57_AMPCI
LCPENATVQAEIVDAHNAFRRAVQPTASDMLIMTYSEEVAVSAQAWVDQCVLAHGPPSTHMLNYVLGSNLFYSSSPKSWTTVVSAWHSEVDHYIYPTGSTNGNTVGHYTQQVIWNSSYKVGCGFALCPNNIYFYGCNYYRGNFKTWRPYTAGPSCGSCPNSCVDKLCNPCPYIDHFINCPTLKNTTGCSNSLVRAWCPASCTCTDEIIPIG